MATINPYLGFNGNCEEAFNFYKSVFGGEFPYIGRYKDMPPSEQHPTPDHFKEKIMHISLPISKETILMGADMMEMSGQKISFGNNLSVSITAQSEDEANRLFKGLSSGGQVTMPMNKTFWGALFGVFTDKFGIKWMVSYESKQSSQ